jgi:hypothetical protein
VYVIFKAFRRLIDEIFLVDNCGGKGAEEGRGERFQVLVGFAFG